MKLRWHTFNARQYDGVDPHPMTTQFTKLQVFENGAWTDVPEVNDKYGEGTSCEHPDGFTLGTGHWRFCPRCGFRDIET